MSNVKESKSNTPMLIIVGVLVVAVLGGWWFYSSSKPAPATNKDRGANAANAANVVKTPAIPANAPIGANPPNQSGSPTASVKLEEFADFQCGSCAAAHPAMNEIKSMYGSRIHFIFRNYPLEIPAHDKAYDAAVATEAAGMQGKFWDMQNLLFSNQQAWTAAPTYRQMWKEYAQRIGLDVAKWETDMAGIVAKGRVDEDIKRGKALNVNSTPTLYINGNAVNFADMKVDNLKQLIDAELNKKTAAAQKTNVKSVDAMAE
jgi:protein-disulfide isomerase